MQGDGPTWFTRVGSALTATGYSSVRREDRRSSSDLMLDIRLLVQMGEYVPWGAVYEVKSKSVGVRQRVREGEREDERDI